MTLAVPAKCNLLAGYICLPGLITQAELTNRWQKEEALPPSGQLSPSKFPLGSSGAGWLAVRGWKDGNVHVWVDKWMDGWRSG